MRVRCHLAFALVASCGARTALRSPMDASPPDVTPTMDASSRDVPTDFPIDATLDMPTDIPVDIVIVPEGPPPRPIAPLSTATVTSQTPTLRWSLVVGTDGARVQICRDRACATVEQTLDAPGDHTTVLRALPAGVHFWRLASRAGATVSAMQSPAWEFVVGHRSVTVDTSWGSVPDVNGDGYADLLVGAVLSDSAYVYLGSATGPGPTPTTLTGPGGSRAFGGSIASAGDVNGDGYADVVVSAYVSDTAYVYLGSASGVSTTPVVTLADPDAPGSGGLQNGFGAGVAGVGDVNGDGYADLVVGASCAPAVGAVCGNGRAYVYLGGPMGTSATPSLTLTGPDGVGMGFGNLGSIFGGTVAGAGDVNGDGYADLIVGASRALSFTGRAYLYLGSAVGLGTTPTPVVAPTGVADFGSSVSCAGDVNGDGYADMIVGTYGPNTAHVFLGGPMGPGAMATTLTGPRGSVLYGSSVASAGDVNGDGFADVIVGSSGSDGAWVYLGGAGGTNPMTSIAFMGPGSSGDSFGASVSGAGDVNGDGYGDFVVGGVADNAAVLYLGGTRGPGTMPTVITGPSGSGEFGFSVAILREGEIARRRRWWHRV